MIHFLDWAVGILTVLYAILLMGYCYWYGKLHFFSPINESIKISNGLTSDNSTCFTVIIPARNEAANIKTCVDSILAQNYPSNAFEIIVIDDFSEDDTAFIVDALHQQHPQVKLLKLADYFKPNELVAFKKKAIEKAVSQAKGDWIVTTDADCIVPENWLKLFDQYILQHQPVFIAAPVMFIKTKGILNQFQLLDFLALQGITAAAVGAGQHSMSNGANLAFEKSAFIAVGGYQGVDNIASGDDMLLMHKMKKTLSKPIGYLFHPDAIVLTNAMTTWRDFIMQRIRWASKARYYDDKSIFWVLLLVYLFNFSFLLLCIVGSVKSLCIALFFKTFFELFFLQPVARFYNLSGELRYFFAYQPLHILYNIIAGLFGQIKTYTWKGRQVK
jgi:cellulose synthase/poly-beta-1,6-N-acetylglucosamine synthase-like glycosyltransferase